jgi:hypothetical protein
VEKYGRARQAKDDNIIWYMHFACWIIKVINTHLGYVVAQLVEALRYKQEGRWFDS